MDKGTSVKPYQVRKEGIKDAIGTGKKVDVITHRMRVRSLLLIPDELAQVGAVVNLPFFLLHTNTMVGLVF